MPPPHEAREALPARGDALREAAGRGGVRSGHFVQRSYSIVHRTTAHERLYVRCRLSIEATVPYSRSPGFWGSLWCVRRPDDFVADADQPFGSQGCTKLVEPGAGVLGVLIEDFAAEEFGLPFVGRHKLDPVR
jgi:hypothetical protein